MTQMKKRQVLGIFFFIAGIILLTSKMGLNKFGVILGLSCLIAGVAIGAKSKMKKVFEEF